MSAIRTTILITLLAAAAYAQQPIGEMQTTDVTVRGAVTLRGETATIQSGAQISTSEKNASVRLARGGELRVCSQSTITLTASASGREQLIGLNGGAIETHYPLGPSSDVIMTPDFRMQLAGPGEFHFAVRTGARGETCVQSLPGNSAALIVSELMGDGAHQVKPGEHVTFRNSSVAKAEGTLEACGCPEEVAVSSPHELGFPEAESRKAEEDVAAGKPLPQPAPVVVAPASTAPGQVQMQIDAPMVFSADTAIPPPDPVLVARAQLAPAGFAPVPLQQPASPPKVKKKWYQRLGAVFASLFKSKS
ncbi:MAG: hypothetical protein HYX26_11265 [Acidobacteriales bacterium]|nr:hypothetical protein [Terriglobales bacterium]